jgi:prepilin-type N-terminal cleavage/methylation domain-containing protein
MRPLPHGRGGAAASQGAFTLVELLIAAAVAATVLGAAYGWLWNVAALASRADDRAQAATLAATASRAIAADVKASLRVAEPPSGRDRARSLALLHDHAGVAPEAVLVVWDPARGVVWRNASGTYLADHITGFSLAYVLAGGGLVQGAAMSPSDWDAVRAVRVDLAASVGQETVGRCVEASVGPS